MIRRQKKKKKKSVDRREHSERNTEHSRGLSEKKRIACEEETGGYQGRLCRINKMAWGRKRGTWETFNSSARPEPCRPTNGQRKVQPPKKKGRKSVLVNGLIRAFEKGHPGPLWKGPGVLWEMGGYTGPRERLKLQCKRRRVQERRLATRQQTTEEGHAQDKKKKASAYKRKRNSQCRNWTQFTCEKIKKVPSLSKKTPWG